MNAELNALTKQMNEIFVTGNTGMEDLSWKEKIKGLVFDISTFLSKQLNIFRKPLIMASPGPSLAYVRSHDYFDYMNKIIVVPENCQGRLYKFTKELYDGAEHIEDLNKLVLPSMIKWLAMVASTNRLNVSNAPSIPSSLTIKQNLDNVLTGKKDSYVTFGEAFSNTREYIETFETFNHQVNTMKTSFPSELLKKVERVNELAAILCDLMSQGEVDLGDSTGAKFVAEKLLSLAQEVTFAGVIISLMLQTGNALTLTGQKLVK